MKWRSITSTFQENNLIIAKWRRIDLYYTYIVNMDRCYMFTKMGGDHRDYVAYKSRRFMLQILNNGGQGVDPKSGDKIISQTTICQTRVMNFSLLPDKDRRVYCRYVVTQEHEYKKK